jgi:hypothetical protein
MAADALSARSAPAASVTPRRDSRRRGSETELGDVLVMARLRGESSVSFTH